jgi:hypothetical protein
MDNPWTIGSGSGWIRVASGTQKPQEKRGTIRGGSLADCLQLAAALPNPCHRLPKFFVCDVEVPLSLLDVRVSEHQLDRTDVDAVGQEPAGAFVAEVMPMQVDLPQLAPIDASTGPGAF